MGKAKLGFWLGLGILVLGGILLFMSQRHQVTHANSKAGTLASSMMGVFRGPKGSIVERVYGVPIYTKTLNELEAGIRQGSTPQGTPIGKALSPASIKRMALSKAEDNIVVSHEVSVYGVRPSAKAAKTYIVKTYLPIFLHPPKEAPIIRLKSGKVIKAKPAKPIHPTDLKAQLMAMVKANGDTTLRQWENDPRTISLFRDILGQGALMKKLGLNSLPIPERYAIWHKYEAAWVAGAPITH